MSGFDRFMTFLTVLFVLILMGLGYTAIKNSDNTALDKLENGIDGGKKAMIESGSYIKDKAGSAMELAENTKEQSVEMLDKAKKATKNMVENTKELAKKSGQASNSIIRTSKDKIKEAIVDDEEEEEDVYLDEEEDKNLDEDRENDLSVEMLLKKQEAKKRNGKSLVEEKKPKEYNTDAKRIENKKPTQPNDELRAKGESKKNTVNTSALDSYNAKHPYWVIAGSFKNKMNAKTEMAKFGKLGYKVELVKRKSLHTICMKQTSSSDAKKLISELKNKHKIDSFLYRYKK